MKGVILYTSKYGATKRYADWLAEETGFDCIETKNAKVKDVMQYDTIILGGGIYASGIAGLSFLKKNIGQLGGKKIIIFCNGASPYEEDAFQQIVEHNLKDALSDLPCYYCRGAWDMDSMSFKDKTLCKMLQKAVAKKDPKDYEVWEYVLRHYHGLKFSPAVEADTRQRADNPKRRQRNARKQLENIGVGTKAQQALQIQLEQNKQERKVKSREQKLAEAERQFALKQQKKREKHKGH